MAEYWFVQRIMRKAGYKGPVTKREHVATDYMGSAEFEFGAVPKSFREMKASSPALYTIPVRALGKDHVFHVIAAGDLTVKQLQSRFQAWIDGGMRGKEYSRLEEAITGRSISGRKITSHDMDYYNPVAWWEIHENFFWSLDEGVSKMWLDYLHMPVETQVA